MAEDGAFNRIDILSNENATYWNRGALVVHGGVGIKNDLYIGGKANILGNTNISGNATINNLEVGNLTFTGTNDFKIKTDLISDGVDLSIGNQTNRFHGYFNEINSVQNSGMYNFSRRIKFRGYFPYKFRAHVTSRPDSF